MLKKILKRIPCIYSVARWIYLNIYINRFVVPNAFNYDKKRYVKYSNFMKPTKERKEVLLTMNYHVIEKGLCMPNFRCGFGYDIVRYLISLINEYLAEYKCESLPIKTSISVLGEYLDVHKSLNFELPRDITKGIESILNATGVAPASQIEMTRDIFFDDNILNSSFEKFSASRKTVRALDGEVSVEQIEKAVSLANNAPSACNRQHCKVHLVVNKDLMSKCLELQHGHRGFGHLADKLIILTSNISVIGPTERNDLFINAGIYLMNLSYSLHKNKVATCILNWSVPPKRDLALRKVLDIPDTESVVVFILCGSVPETFKIATSPRRTIKETLITYN